MVTERYSEWINDPHGSTYGGGERIPVKVCLRCGASNPFNIVGDPYYPQYCTDCGSVMLNSQRITEEIFGGE